MNLGGWRPSAALERAIVVVAVLVLCAVLFRRPDLAVLAIPFLVGTGLGLAGIRRGELAVRTSAAPVALLEGDTTDVTVTVGSTGPLDVVAVTVGYGAGLIAESAPRARRVRYARVTSLAAGQEVDLRFPLRSVRWGRAMVGPVSISTYAADGLLCRDPVRVPDVGLHVWPLRESFQATETVPRAEGMVGLHRSRLLGDGTDIAEVRPFQPGDRLRRINWRISMREQALHVTSTVSDRDTDVVLCLDTRYEVWTEGRGPRRDAPHGLGEDESSLDLAVRAAAAIAEHYLRAGDRVGLVDLGQPLRRVRQGAGRAHLMRLFEVLLDVRGYRRVDQTIMRLALSELPPGALVVIMSPLVGEAAFGSVATLARSGHSVVAVDTLPPNPGPGEPTEWTELAWRVWWLERSNSIGRLSELGVAVVPWSGAGSLDDVLRDVSRAARAPRLRR